MEYQKRVTFITLPYGAKVIVWEIQQVKFFEKAPMLIVHVFHIRIDIQEKLFNDETLNKIIVF